VQLSRALLIALDQLVNHEQELLLARQLQHPLCYLTRELLVDHELGGS
jgi:hypothetical protein